MDQFELIQVIPILSHVPPRNTPPHSSDYDSNHLYQFELIQVFPPSARKPHPHYTDSDSNHLYHIELIQVIPLIQKVQVITIRIITMGGGPCLEMAEGGIT